MPSTVLDSRDYGEIELREQLSRITNSRTFGGSNRHQRFLNYVVHGAIHGETAKLKGYALGLDVFDRSVDFDPQTDPIVRIEAGRLRRSLERYYLTEGKNDPIVIRVPKGGYVPTFSEPEPINPASAGPLADIVTEPPAVVVLQFRNLGDPSDDRLVDIITEEISVNLARFRQIDVIHNSSPNATAQFSLRGTLQDLSGTARSTMVSLIENRTGKSIWVEVYESQECEPSLREIAASIAAEIGHPLGSLARFVAAEGNFRYRSYTALHDAHRYGQTRDGTRLARVRALLRDAVVDDPRNAEALAMLSILELDRSIGGIVVWTTHPTVVRRSLQLAERAVGIDPSNAIAHQAILEARFRLGHVDQALEAGRKAVQLNPNNSTLLAVFGAVLCYSGNWEEGQLHLRKSRKLVIQIPYWYRIVDIFGHYQRREYRLALNLAVQMNSRCIVPPVLRAMLYGRLKMTRKGRRELHELSEAAPGVTREDIRSIFSMRAFDKAAIGEFIKHLDSVGLSDMFPTK